MASSDPFIGLVFLAAFAGLVVYGAYSALRTLALPRLSRWAYAALQLGVTGGLTLAALAFLARMASR